MRRTLLLASLLAALIPVSAYAEPSLVRFEGGIGETPVSTVNAATGLSTPNAVRGISPGAQPWVISRLSVDVKTDGRISVDGRGLLLAGGNGIGTNGAQSVHALLFCGSGTTQTTHNSDPAGVPLEADGDFRINDVLSPAVPAVCDTPALLIVNTGNRWFAAGIPKL